MIIKSPFEQFEIVNLATISLFNLNLSFTNLSIYTFLVVFIWFCSFNFFLLKFVPTKVQLFLETIFLFIHSLVEEHLGKEEFKFFPFFVTLFSFLFGCNMLGMFPYSFTVTSHVCVTFGLSFSICLAIFILGLQHHGFHFFSCFLPSGSPLLLAPLLISIEIVSYLSHSFSLAIRLFANMLAGHALLKILAGFVWTMWGIGGVFLPLSVAPISIVAAITVLELGIAFLQAYVFTVLTCIYMKDAIHLH
jgi:ATP synthase subunit 6